MTIIEVKWLVPLSKQEVRLRTGWPQMGVIGVKRLDLPQNNMGFDLTLEGTKMAIIEIKWLVPLSKKGVRFQTGWSKMCVIVVKRLYLSQNVAFFEIK